MAMKKSTRNLLIGLGVVTAAGIGYHLMTKDDKKAAEKKNGVGPIIGKKQAIPQDPGGLPTIPVEPLELPVWSEDLVEPARIAMAEKYVEMGEPTVSPQVWVTLANHAANVAYPNWSWPENVQKSDAFFTSEDAGVQTWTNLINLAKNVTGLGDQPSYPEAVPGG